MHAPDLRAILYELETAWNEEQKKRHEFWVGVNESPKAAFNYQVLMKFLD